MGREPEGNVVDRRRAPRVHLTLSARLVAAAHTRLAVTRNISQTGALLLAAGRFQPGEEVEISVLPEHTDTEVHVRGKVVRAQTDAVDVPWRCIVAVCFEAPLPVDSALFA